MMRLLTRVSPVVLLFGLAAIYRAPFGREIPGERIVFAGLVLAVLAAIAYRLPLLSFSKWRATWIVAFLGWLAVSLLYSLGSPYTVTFYTVGDFATLLLPVLLVLAAAADDRVLSRDSFLTLVASVAVAGFLAPIGYSLIQGPIYNRYEPAHFFAAVPIILFVFVASARRQRVSWFLVFLGLLLAAWASGQRTNVMIYLAVFAGVSFLKFSAKLPPVVTILLLATAGAAMFGVARPATEFVAETSVVQESRFRALFNESGDPSLVGRQYEVADVFDIVLDEWSAHEWLLGAGHGAMFVPNRSFPERNIRDGRVHNIHVGPVRMLYRYGLIGLVLNGMAVLVALRLCLRGLPALRLGLTAGGGIGTRFDDRSFREAVLGIILFCILADSLVRNPLSDPVTMVALGLAFAALGERRPAMLSDSRHAVSGGGESEVRPLAC